jgi:hypothetical protein
MQAKKAERLFASTKKGRFCGLFTFNQLFNAAASAPSVPLSVLP